MREYPSYGLSLADGSHWLITGTDKDSADIVTQFAKVMRLGITNGEGRHLFVTFRNHDCQTKNPEDIICILKDGLKQNILFTHFANLSRAIVRVMQKRGGLLLHGALAEKNGQGVIFAAPGGTGKTTASQRLPLPWHSLSDDATLIVRGENGAYWAHPWPTWGLLLFDGTNNSWDVQNSVILKDIFFLVQAEQEHVETVGKAEAVSMLLASTQQVMNVGHLDSTTEKRFFHMERFDNICSLVSKIRVLILSLSIGGSFWKNVENELEEDN